MKLRNNNRKRKHKLNIITSRYKKLFKRKYGMTCSEIKATGGYFIFADREEEETLVLKFKGLSQILFGIWKRTTTNNESRYYYFAEHEAFIDKFKPTAVYMNFGGLCEMVDFAKKISKDENTFYTEMARLYHYETIEDVKKAIEEISKYAYNGLTADEVTNAKNLIINLSKEYPHITFILQKSISYRDLYDVWFYGENNDNEFDKVYQTIYGSNSFDTHLFPHTHYLEERELKLHAKQYKFIKNGEFF